MEELKDIYNADKQSKDPLSQVPAQAPSQSLYKKYNTIPNYPDKTRGQKSQLNNLGKTIARLIRKANSFISDGLLEKLKVPVSLEKLNIFTATNFKLASRYLGFSNLFVRGKKLQQPLNDERDADLNLDVIDKKVIRKLQDSITSHSMGKVMKNHKGEFLGTIKQITYDDDKSIQYIILNCTNFFGKKNRYFAIPAFSTLIELDEKGQVVMNIDKNELKLAKGIAANKCPKLSLKFGQSIYELYHYSVSAEQTSEK